MRKLLLLLLLGISFSGISQSLGTNHFLEIKPSHSCYIKAVEHLNLWQVSLTRFNKSGTTDTTFITPYLLPDTILKAMLVRLEEMTPSDTLAKQDDYKENIGLVQSVLQKLQVTYKNDVNAGQLELIKIIPVQKIMITVIPKKQWHKLKDKTPYRANTNVTAPLGKPIYKTRSRVYYKDSTYSKKSTVSLSKAAKQQRFLPIIIFPSILYLPLRSLPQTSPYPDMYDTNRLVLYRHRKFVPISFYRRAGKKDLYFEKIERKYTVQIESADFYIKDGFIDNMSFIVKDGDTKLQFTNAFPIPLSSKKNIRMLNQTFLYANQPGLLYKLNLGEVMKYYFAVEKDQYDLSPSDTLLKFEFKNNTVVEIATLKKEDKNKIFEYRVFTDFIGLDETKPNGLVQIEAQRKFKLYTKYSFQRFPIGGLRYIEPSFKWNKIENQKSFLQPFSTDTFSVDSVRQSGVTKAQYNARRNGFVTPLDLYLYQQISVGFNLNLISGYNGNTKLKYNIDGILNFGRTKIRDSIPEVDTSYTPYRVVNSKQAPKELKVNTLQWGLSFKVQFFPEARYGFTIGAKYLNIYLANMDFKQKNKSYLNAYTDDTYFNRGIVCSEIQVHKNFDNDSKFYIRYVFNSQLNNFKYNFSQFQVGYNAFLKF